MSTNKNAVYRLAPHGASTGAHEAAFSVALTTTSTAEQDTGFAGSAGACWVSFTADASFFIRFGPTGIGASTTSDFLLPSGTVHEYCIRPQDRFFRAILGSGTGTLRWHKSGA